ncbi:MAG: PAS domain S-box protein [Pirellulaceae bacterium]|nr:PAS domain S-box protein [Pirellulaceae bacterium]
MLPEEPSRLSPHQNERADSRARVPAGAKQSGGESFATSISVDLLSESVSRLDEGILITGDDVDWPQPTILFANDAMCRLTGYAAEELVGETPQRLHGEFVERATIERITAELHAGLAALARLVILRKDQTLVVVELFVSPLFDSQGRRTNFLAIFRDLTHEKQSEEAIRASETRYRMAIELTGLLPWTTNQDGEVVEDSPIWRKFTGLSFAEFQGMGWSKAIHPDDVGATLNSWRKAIVEQTPFETEFRLRRFDGTYRTFMCRAVPLIEQGGRVQKWFGTNTDITERRQGEARIAADLDAMTRLHQLGTLSAGDGNLSAVLEGIVETAIALAKSDFGDIQLLDPATGRLRIVAQCGFPQWWLDFWNEVPEGTGACGAALQGGQPVIVEDVEQSPIFVGTEALETMRRVNVRAVISTPLISRKGKLLGIFSTHFRVPHQPAELDLLLFDLLARQAADIIERQTTEMELRHAYERQKKVLAVETVGVMFWDLITSRMTDANQTFLNMMGYSREDLESGELTWQKLTPPEYVEASLAEIRKFAATGRVGPYEKEYFRKDGSRKLLLFAGSALGENQCVEFCIDISDRKRAEQIAHDREERLAAVINTTSDAIITIDHHGNIVSANPATERLFGYGTAELVGRNVRILMPNPYCDEHDSYIKSYLETGKARIIGIGREVIGKRKDGSTFPIDLNVSEIPHLRLFTGIIRDISERKNLQRDVLGIAEDEQRRIGQDLHDGVQQELAGIGLLAQTLLSNLQRELDRHSNPSVEQCCQLTQKILAGLTRTHQDVRTISRGLIPIQLGSSGLMDALRELALRTDGLKQIKCAFKCDRPVNINDSTTATHLFRIAQEAVTNSMRHSQAQHILIELQETDEGNFLLKVADDGIGFDSLAAADGLGLRSMRYRAGLIGAHLMITPGDSGGTLVTCKVYRESTTK